VHGEVIDERLVASDESDVIVQQERLEEDEDAQNAGAGKHYSKSSRVSNHKDKPVSPRIRTSPVGLLRRCSEIFGHGFILLGRLSEDTLFPPKRTHWGGRGERTGDGS